MKPYKVMDKLYFGEAPGNDEDIEALKALGCDTIFALNWVTETRFYDEQTEAEAHGMMFVRMAFEDGEHMDPFLLEAIVSRIGDLIMRAGKTVYVHCAAGLSRSPFIAACCISMAKKVTLDVAMETVRTTNPGIMVYDGFDIDYQKWAVFRQMVAGGPK